MSVPSVKICDFPLQYLSVCKIPNEVLRQPLYDVQFGKYNEINVQESIVLKST